MPKGKTKKSTKKTPEKKPIETPIKEKSKSVIQNKKALKDKEKKEKQ